MSNGNQKWNRPFVAQAFPQIFNHWCRPEKAPTPFQRAVPAMIWGVIAGIYFGLGFFVVFGPF